MATLKILKVKPKYKIGQKVTQFIHGITVEGKIAAIQVTFEGKQKPLILYRLKNHNHFAGEWSINRQEKNYVTALGGYV